MSFNMMRRWSISFCLLQSYVAFLVRDCAADVWAFLMYDSCPFMRLFDRDGTSFW